MPLPVFSHPVFGSLPRSAHSLRGAALCALVLLGACGEAPAPRADAGPAAPILQNQQLRFPPGHPQLALLSTQAATEAQDLVVDLPARLTWNEERTQRIYPAFGGRVSSLLADVGQAVKPGTPLARLASPDFGQAQAETARARADAQLADKALARQRELFDAGITARKELDQAEAEAARARAEVARATARTAMYGQANQVDQQLGLQASIPGVVVERNLNPGQELRPEQSGPGVPPLFVVTDPASLWIQIDARDIDVGTLRPGARFDVLVPAYPHTHFEGKVIAAADFIDPNTRTVKVRGAIDNPDRKLKAEMLVTARVSQPFAAGVVVPSAAIILRGSTHMVFVQSQPGVFEPREVALAHQGPKESVVSTGLKAGEQVVADNALLLLRLFSVTQDEAKPRAADSAEKADHP